MIQLHRLNGAEVVVNAELIEAVEGCPDTVLSLATGNRFIVRESVLEVIQRIVEYKKTVYVGAAYLPTFLKQAPAKDSGGSVPHSQPPHVWRKGDQTCR
jgi:flagellar protein FlbD